jgi:argininosuccinate lyase
MSEQADPTRFPQALAGGAAGDPAPRWAGATAAPLSEPMLALSGTAVEDAPLAAHDVAASLVHVTELARLGLLSHPAAAEATDALRAIGRELAAGTFAWRTEHEDVHMNVEAALADRAGEHVAGQLQAGRSRNEQIVTDERLWLLGAAANLDAAMARLQTAVLARADEELAAGTVLPGHTHLQPAQPVLLAHALLAWFEMLDRDRGRMADVARRANRSPAGSGALAGSGLPLDRERIAAQLGFAGITANSIDAVSDRDYAAELVSACAIAAGHLSRLAGELALWATPYLGWATLGDGWVSGSSMLPNKRNPDSCELVRARAARIAADLSLVLEVPRGLPLAYHRDLQETRRAMLDAADSLALCLEVMTGVVRTVAFDRTRMRAAAAASQITATALAELLVAAGVPFRVAHHRVGALVAMADAAGCPLDGLPDADLAAALPELAGMPRAVPSLDEAVAAPDVPGGTAPARVAQALAAAHARVEAEGA